MKLFSGLWSFLKDVTSFIFDGPDFRSFDLDLKGLDKTLPPRIVRIPPRKEWTDGDERDPEFVCDHPPESGWVEVTVLGHKMWMDLPSELAVCRGCFEKWLNRHATTCAACGEPILTGRSVAERSPFDDPPFVHMRPMCCRYPSKFCGKWGQGRLISLHEMYPDQIPPGTRTIADYAMLKNPGQPWFEDWNPKVKPN